MKVLVTGGAGFIGSHVVDAYVNAGHEVVVLDDLSTGKLENINPKARFVKMDIQDPKVQEIFDAEQFEVVNHHAAQMDIRKSVADPLYDARVNILGTLNLLENSAKHKINKFIFISSGGAIYGEQDTFPADETHPTRPLSPYGVAKLTGEKYLYYYAATYHLNYVVLRYANIFGPRQNPEGEAGVVAIFASKLLAGQQPIINGDGKQTRDFVFVADIARANLKVLDYPKTATFNLGTSKEIDINEIFRLLNRATGDKAKEMHGPAKPGEQLRSVIDYANAKTLLGWQPEVSLESGLLKTIDYFRKRAS
ncbi:NAD-dependent epimerase/dehydratase family protein [candidate division KSB1 bacterium]|nr:NAD-dependent epimerase/dehydratase family protein [candidate division KSB1 bacterium]